MQNHQVGERSEDAPSQAGRDVDEQHLWAGSFEPDQGWEINMEREVDPETKKEPHQNAPGSPAYTRLDRPQSARAKSQPSKRGNEQKRSQ